MRFNIATYYLLQVLLCKKLLNDMYLFQFDSLKWIEIQKMYGNDSCLRGFHVINLATVYVIPLFFFYFVIIFEIFVYG